MKKNRLLLFDTSNYIDLPIGGQLTSISNFLKYVKEYEDEIFSSLVLVGVTKEKEKLGKMDTVLIHGEQVKFLPVALVESDLSHTAKSLRLQYVKGLVKYGRVLKIKRSDCCYLHTPEAYGAIKVIAPMAKCAVFSHGSFFNMEKGFRFFQKNKLIKKMFNLYLYLLLIGAKIIFVLDEDSKKAYLPFNKKIKKVNNSIIIEENYEGDQLFRKKLLFVGRLSKEKQVDTIIRAVNELEEEYTLTVVGDGEMYDSLISYQSDRIVFTGALTPNKVKEIMKVHDVLIMNSTIEGIPMTILEGFSFGLPVVTTPVGGIPEVVSFGRTGECTEGTKESIVRGVEKIADNYSSYSKHAMKAVKNFSYKTVNKEIVEELKKYWKI